ncbi:MAG: hypothetical protein MI743_12400 [Sneathiellales bacterium]|nr:hypothetical protein [Sneathiellales bacterium]
MFENHFSGPATWRTSSNFSQLLKTVIVTSALAVGTSLITIPDVSAADTAKIKHMSIKTVTNQDQIIYVISTDGKKWNKIQSGKVHFRAKMTIDTKWPGYVSSAAVYLGKCNGAACAPTERLFEEVVGDRDFFRTLPMSFNPTALMKAPIGKETSAKIGKHIIDRCNKHLTPGGPTVKRSFSENFVVTLGASSGKATYFDNVRFEISPLNKPTHIAHSIVPMPVICLPVEKKPEPVNLDVDEKAPMKLKKLDLFLSTYSNAVSKPSIGLECKKGKILLRAAANREGPVKLKLWTKLGHKQAKSQLVNAWAKPVGGGKYQAEFAKWVSVSKTTTIKAKVNDLTTKPTGLKVAWKKLKLQCKTPGVGGLSQQK